MNKLRECPFCGNKPQYFDACGREQVLCLNCGIGTDTSRCVSKDVIFKIWNTRAKLEDVTVREFIKWCSNKKGCPKSCPQRDARGCQMSPPDEWNLEAITKAIREK